jgi:hypothetical protein
VATTPVWVDDRARALACAGEALRDAPSGACGLVHRVTLSFARVGYVYDALVARGRFDPVSGAVVWEELPARTSWERLNASLAEPRDAIPPEAFAAGLADLKSERERRLLLGLPVDSRDLGGL